MTEIATAYAASLLPEAKAAAAAPAQVTVHFLARLNADTEGNARTDIFNVTINGIAAEWDASSGTISSGSIVLPAMVVSIAPAIWQAQPVPQDQLPDGVTLAYRYCRTIDHQAQYLGREAALAIAERQVSMASLDVLALQSGWASVFVQRNLALFPADDLGTVRTREAFLFQTPEVRFASPVVPRLSHDSFSLNDMAGAGGDLDALLTSFFRGLYSAGTGQTSVDVSMQGLYSYLLVAGDAGIPRVQLPITLLTPSPSVVSPDVKPDFIAPFAAVVDDWRATNRPTVAGDARVDIELKVFGTTGNARQPLIAVRRLTQDVPPE